MRESDYLCFAWATRTICGIAKTKWEGGILTQRDLVLGRYILDQANLTDLGCKGPYCTWSNGQLGYGRVCEGLDRGAANAT